MGKVITERRPARFTMLGIVAILVSGCSWLPNAVNPVEWYRDATGASQDDESGSERNAQNLEAGGKQPYPNLATVPKPPDTALSTAEREKLQKGLVADRSNARYSDEELRQGRTVPPLPGESPVPATTSAVPPTAPAADATPQASQAAATGSGDGAAITPGGAPRRAPPARGSAAPPQESPLVTPQVRSTPEGEPAHAPPPAPAGVPQRDGRQLALVAPPPPPAAPSPSQPAIMRAPSSGKRANVVLQAAEVVFAGDGTSVSNEDNQRLAEVAQFAKNAGAQLRVIGYMRAASSGDAAQRELQAFDMAIDRANAVAQALIKLGVAANRITVQAAPELASAGSDAARAEVLLEY